MRHLIIAPHPDDELLGCGGTILRLKYEDHVVGWVIITGISESSGWRKEQVISRRQEIVSVKNQLGFDHLYQFDLPATELDQIPSRNLIRLLGEVVIDFQPDEIYLPHPSDVHSDHRIVFDAAMACTKYFRYPSIKRVFAYETLSETEFGLYPEKSFHPTVFINITDYLQRKLELLKIYTSEIGAFPFPRSVESVRALAMLRGSTAGYEAAEAFQLLRERY